MGFFRNLVSKKDASARTIDADSMPILENTESLQNESVIVQKIHKLIFNSITKDYFDTDSIRIICSLISRLDYALADKAVSNLFKTINPMWDKNDPDHCASESDIESAKRACLEFNAIVENRHDDGLGPYVGKGFSLTGTFLFGSQSKVIDHLEELGCKHVKNNYSENYSDYIFIGCKPTKRHPSDDFTDCIQEENGIIPGEDGFYRKYILETYFPPLNE